MGANSNELATSRDEGGDYFRRTRSDVTCSVCIPTCRRHKELATCLGALADQTVLPDEIVLSDAGGDIETTTLLDAFRSRRPWTVRHCPTPRSGLPWQRWWAFQHSCGSIVMFLDDDIRLAPDALALLLDTYRKMPDIAGAGFAIAYEGCPPGLAQSSLRRERWLGIVGAKPGTITSGGISIELPLKDRYHAIEEVEWLSGGAMSFRREALKATPPLEHLFDLYDAHIGKAEDSLLSKQVRRHGPLVLIPGIFAEHPSLERATRTESPQDGYHKGLLETLGRAHVLRWLASDPASAFHAWLRVGSLEILRAGKAVLERPLRPSRWLRILGGLVGLLRTVRRWNQIPLSPSRTDSAPQSGAEAFVAPPAEAAENT
jgi:GT2 family glycosyltransferase